MVGQLYCDNKTETKNVATHVPFLLNAKVSWEYAKSFLKLPRADCEQNHTKQELTVMLNKDFRKKAFSFIIRIESHVHSKQRDKARLNGFAVAEQILSSSEIQRGGRALPQIKTLPCRYNHAKTYWMFHI